MEDPLPQFSMTVSRENHGSSFRYVASVYGIVYICRTYRDHTHCLTGFLNWFAMIQPEYRTPSYPLPSHVLPQLGTSYAPFTVDHGGQERHVYARRLHGFEALVGFMR